MAIINPTLDTYRDFASRENMGFRDYFNQCVLAGDDGNEYFLDFLLAQIGIGAVCFDSAFLVVGKQPLWCYTTPKRKVIQKGERPEIDLRVKKPSGTMQSELSDSAFTVKLDEFSITCAPPSYRLRYDGDNVSADLRMESLGTPFWFNQGKEEGARISPSTLIHGLELFGEISGTLMLNGKMINVTGFAIHEHIISEQIAWLESVWQDWIWVVFDDLYALVYEKQGGAYKDGCIYLRKEQEYLVVNDLEIDHPQWAYSPTLECDWPIKIEARAYTDKGTLHIRGDVVRSLPMPEFNEFNPCVSIPFTDMQVNWSGSFTYTDGRVIELENGKGADEIIAVYNFTK